MAKAHHTKEFRLMRAVVVWMFDSTCLICNEFNENIEVHHCDKNRLNNHLTNLAPLCPKHHKWAHLYASTVVVPNKLLLQKLIKKINLVLSYR